MQKSIIYHNFIRHFKFKTNQLTQNVSQSKYLIFQKHSKKDGNLNINEHYERSYC